MVKNLSNSYTSWVASALYILAFSLVSFGGVSGQTVRLVSDPGDEEVTFTRDVMPILQENCTGCHREGSIAPIHLETYEQARRYSRRIRDKVVTREMPPFHLDTDVGIQEIKGDWRLSEDEIKAIAAWVDNGSPRGDIADMPPAVEWSDELVWQLEETLGPPDHVIKSKPFDVPAEGGDQWWRPIVETGLDKDRYVKAFETRPSRKGREVVHHAIPRLQVLQENGEYRRTASLSEYAMGKIGEILPLDAARLLPKESRIEWDAHYYPMGYDVEDDQVELGIWFHPEGFEPDFIQDLRLYPLQGDIALAPGGTAMTQGFFRFDHPVRIDSFQPHGHVHLHAKSMEVIYPDGKRELLSMVTNFNAKWHHSYIYEDDVAPLLPEGSVLVVTAWYDNTADNPLNPDPEVWKARGSRTVDEMSHAWIAVTHLNQEGFERLVSEREAKKEAVTATEQASGSRR
tara:strand:+ start:10955 stop:12325 length:1371 start_codon:yes stop_codon:yes gene_type:complete